jgi:hypothetical protein
LSFPFDFAAAVPVAVDFAAALTSPLTLGARPTLVGPLTAPYKMGFSPCAPLLTATCPIETSLTTPPPVSPTRWQRKVEMSGWMVFRRCARGRHKLVFTIHLRSLSRLTGRPSWAKCSAASVGPKSAWRCRTRVKICCSNRAANLRFDGRPGNPWSSARSPRFLRPTSNRRICRSLIFRRLAASIWVTCLRLTSCSTRSL